MIICDTDILSMFAKADAIDVLIKTLSNFNLCITPRIKEELSVPLQYGYSFPQIIFDRMELIFPTETEAFLYEELRNKNQSIGKGEIEAISIAKNRKCIFATNDKIAIETALAEGVTVINVHTVLKVMLKKGEIDKASVRQLIYKLEEMDNAIILGKDEIFEERL